MPSEPVVERTTAYVDGQNLSTTVTKEMTCGLAELRILHPPGTFPLSPASLIALEAIGRHQERLSGIGLDWGSGTGCLAIAAAKAPGVERVVGLEISKANVAIARENAKQNGVDHKVVFVLSDSYSPLCADDCAILDGLRGKVNFLLANPPSSDGDDGFTFRRIVLQGAPAFLVPGGVVFLNISWQYGQRRVKQLCQDPPGFEYQGVLASTNWVPFDLNRPDLKRCLHQYAEEERRGGFDYAFGHPEPHVEATMTAQAALAHYQSTGQSPLTRWQSHLFVFKGAPSR